MFQFRGVNKYLHSCS